MAKRKYRRRRAPKRAGNYQQMKRVFVSGSWVALVAVILFFVGRYILRERLSATDKTQTVNISQLDAVVVPKNVTNQVYAYKGFIVYFNRDYHIPNCVSYELTDVEAEGDLPRYKNFETDPNLPGSANPWDYTRSGYDRGHMAPAADMKWNRDAMRESFYMTNVSPQARRLNEGAWKKLEDKVRDWVLRDKSLIVVTGPILSNNMPRIGETGVAVPGAFFKVILAPKASPQRAIAFIYPNETARGGMDRYAVSVDDVETRTGLDFFSALPDKVENRVEAQCDLNEWNQRR